MLIEALHLFQINTVYCDTSSFVLDSTFCAVSEILQQVLEALSQLYNELVVVCRRWRLLQSEEHRDYYGPIMWRAARNRPTDPEGTK